MDYFKKQKSIVFPEPKGININMMPFIMGDYQSLPDFLRSYFPIIDACQVPIYEIGKVCYLTINESVVLPGQYQRKQGIHIERHPTYKGQGRYWDGKGYPNPWYGGHNKNSDLFMASNINNSTRVWNNYLKEPNPHGECEFIRPKLGRGHLMKANTLYWLTDGTPHEALPLNEKYYRQYFSLVTSNIALWFEKNSTPNPKGIKPSCMIIKENKFKLI